MENYNASLEAVHKALQSAKYTDSREKAFQVSCSFARLIGTFEGLHDTFTPEQKRVIVKAFERAIQDNPFIITVDRGK